jgi:ubiquitin carboxyl-terminal hydrolase 8
MEINKYKNRGLIGLANLGNTCFINSCMQILSNTYELNDFLEKETYKKNVKNKIDSVLLIEWDNLRKLIWEAKNVGSIVITPNKFIKTIQKVASSKNLENFTGYAQNDVSEFLLFLIDCFHNSLSRKIKMSISGNPENETDNLALKCFKMIQETYSNDYSEIWNLFYGVHVSELMRSDNNKIISQKPEPFFMIDLPIPPENKSPSLLDCFDLFVNGETIENYKDEMTNEKIDIKKRILFWSFPNILTIDLKRFNNRFQKNQICISYPINCLDLSSYVIGYKKENYKYELYGVCNHSGGVMGGHYTAYVKNANGKWYHFNDTIVSEVAIEDKIISSNAYVLFYRKKIE